MSYLPGHGPSCMTGKQSGMQVATHHYDLYNYTCARVNPKLVSVQGVSGGQGCLVSLIAEQQPRLSKYILLFNPPFPLSFMCLAALIGQWLRHVAAKPEAGRPVPHCACCE